MHPQILRDGLALPPPTRHQDRLTPVTQASVSGRLEDVFQLVVFRWRQLNPPHLFQPPLLRTSRKDTSKKMQNHPVHVLEQIQQFLGHARLETTQIYAESTAAMIKESYQKALGR